jgi:hypothetical protein
MKIALGVALLLSPVARAQAGETRIPGRVRPAAATSSDSARAVAKSASASCSASLAQRLRAIPKGAALQTCAPVSVRCPCTVPIRPQPTLRRGAENSRRVWAQKGRDGLSYTSGEPFKQRVTGSIPVRLMSELAHLPSVPVPQMVGVFVSVCRIDHERWGRREVAAGVLRPLTWTTVRGGARWHGFPLTPGTRRGRNYMSALTTTHALTAWLLSRPYNGHPKRVFRERPRADGMDEPHRRRVRPHVSGAG